MEKLQHELYENARRRIKQKKLFFFHFVVFFVGSLFFLALDNLFDVGVQYKGWSFWAIILWAFLFILHFVKVFITNRFMNKDWEREEIEKLVVKQQKKIEELQRKVETDFSKNNTTSL